MQRSSEAVEDAEKALTLKKESTRALIAKAEALYSMGRFEKALMLFEKGWKIRQDTEMKAGITMCREVILNTVGHAMEYDKSIVRKVVREENKIKMKADLAMSFNTKIKASEDALKKEQERRNADKKILGKMQKDLDFLQNFLKFQDSDINQTNSQNEDRNVKNTTTNALDYLEKRKTFWQQTATKKLL